MPDTRYLKEYLKHQKTGSREFMNRSALNMQQQSASIQLAMSSSGKSPDPKSGSVYKNHNSNA